MSILTLRQAPPGRPAPRRFDWLSPAAVPRLWLTVGLAGSAAFAVALAMVTVWQAHRLWGIFAGISYLLAAMFVLVWKSRGLDVALVTSLAGALVTPMWLMAGHGLQQPEGEGIEKSASMLLHRGTPYPGRPRPMLAGLALGVAAAMKATAWPALAVAAVLLLARDGRRAAVTMTATALAVVAAVVGPVAAAGPRSLVQNTIAFPLGLTSVKSDAVSPLPGRLLAETGQTGHLIAVVLLALAGLAVIVSLVVRPPRTVRAAVWRLIIALTAMFVLAPATRFGYIVYPVGLLAWLEVSRMGAEPALEELPGLRDPGGVARSANSARQDAYQ